MGRAAYLTSNFLIEGLSVEAEALSSKAVQAQTRVAENFVVSALSWCASSISSLRIALFLQFSGGYIGGVTPVPIPNTEVKPTRADGTARETVWESRSLPDPFGP